MHKWLPRDFVYAVMISCRCLPLNSDLTVSVHRIKKILNYVYNSFLEVIVINRLDLVFIPSHEHTRHTERYNFPSNVFFVHTLGRADCHIYVFYEEYN